MKRNYRKADFCNYCETKVWSKISKHYLYVHAKEPEVEKLIQFPIGSKARKRALMLLQNEGNFRHNTKVYSDKLAEHVTAICNYYSTTHTDV
jgi:hypothetical protein